MKEHKTWSKHKLDKWRKSIIGKSWEIYWEPEKDNSEGDDENDSGLIDTDSEDEEAWDADWYDGLIKSYSHKTGYFSIIFVGEEDMIYSMKLKPSLVRPLEKNKKNNGNDNDGNKEDESNGKSEGKIDGEHEDDSLDSDQEVEFDEQSGKDESDNSDDGHDDESNDSNDDDYDDYDDGGNDEDHYDDEDEDDNDGIVKTTKDSYRMHSKDGMVKVKHTLLQYPKQPTASKEKKRKYDAYTEPISSQDNAMNIKIKKRKIEPTKSQNVYQPRTKKSKQKLQKKKGNNHIQQEHFEQATIEEDSRNQQTKIEDDLSHQHISLPKCSPSHSSKEKESHHLATHTRKEDRTPSSCKKQHGTVGKVCNQKKKPLSSLLARTIGMIAVEQDKKRQLQNYNDDQHEGTSPLNQRLQQLLSSPSSREKVKKEQDNDFIVHSPPKGVIPIPQSTTLLPAKTERGQIQMKTDNYHIKQDKQDEKIERQRYYLSKNIKTKSQIGQNDEELKPILSKAPKYSIRNHDDADRPCSKDAKIKTGAEITESLLSTLCTNKDWKRKVKFVMHLNQTQYYSPTAILSQEQDTFEAQGISNEIIPIKQCADEKQNLIIDKFIKRNVENQQASKALFETERNEEQQRQKKKLLAYVAVNGTMDDMITCLKNGASVRGSKDERPLDKVKEAKENLRQELKQYNKRDQVMDDILSLTNKICKKNANLDNLWKQDKCDRNTYIRIKRQLTYLEHRIQSVGKSIGLFFRYDPAKCSYLISDMQATKIKVDVLKLRLADLTRKQKVLKIYKEVEIIAEIAQSLHPKKNNIDRNRQSYRKLRKDCNTKIKEVCAWVKRFQIEDKAVPSGQPVKSGNIKSDLSELSSVVNVNISPAGNFTMLHAAVCVFAIDSIRNLFEIGAKIDIMSDEFGTVIELAESLQNEAKSRGDRKYENAFKDVLRQLKKTTHERNMNNIENRN